MKKEINSKTKRKWIMGGLAAFASIAMLTTGFAVWVVGVQQTEKDNNVNVKVDTAENQTLYFDMQLSDTDSNIVLAEAAEVNTGFVKAQGAEVVAKPLQITFSTITIRYGKYSKIKPTKIQFSIDGANHKVQAGGDKIGGRTRNEDDTDWTYIDAPKEITLPKDGEGVSTDENENTTISLSNVPCDFEWGSFFGGESPCTFYNNKFQGQSDSELLKAGMDQKVVAELNAMYTALNGTVSLKAKLA